MPTGNIHFVHPIALSFTLSMSILMLFLPRRFVLLPMLMTACYVTLGQRMIIASLDFTMLRILDDHPTQGSVVYPNKYNR